MRQAGRRKGKVVRRIFALYLGGYGIQAIANILNDEDAPKRSGHAQWRSRTVNYILTNERYIGDALLQKKYRTETLPHRLKLNKGEKPMYYVENSNPPIISREVFNAAMELRKSKNAFGRHKNHFPLTGMMISSQITKS